MKVYKKKFAHRNMLIFIILSVVYLRIVYAFSHGFSFFSQTNFIAFVLSNSLVLLLLPFVFHSVFTFKNYARIILVIFFSIIVIASFILLSTSFNKLVLALNFAFIFFAFYFFTSWEIERDEAGYNPSFSYRDLEKKTRFSIEGVLYSGDRTKSEKIFLTNIDEKSCYVILEKGNVDIAVGLLEINLDGVVFSSQVRRISKYDQGQGFSFEGDLNSFWSLLELCKICRQRGFFLV